MKVIRAAAMGFCFGVRDALEITRSISSPDNVTIHGELVHNPVVLYELKTRGFAASPEDARSIPETDTVLITAHGASDKERGRLTRAGKTLIDTTCPLVTRVHRAAAAFQRCGYFVVVIGRPGHVEVCGIVEDLDSFDVVPDPASARLYADVDRIGIVCQTTTPPAHADQVREAVAGLNPQAEIRFIDTVCRPTRERQAAVDELAARVDVIVVVGGRNSNNTHQLVQRVSNAGKLALHVESAADLRREWFAGLDRIGLTAGTSTPDSVIDEVHRTLESMSASVSA